MEWVAPFYARQHEWLPEYAESAVSERHRAIAARIGRLTSGPPGRVLELGAGGGHAAAATADLGYDVVAVELVERAAARARSLATEPRPGSMTVHRGDFYDIEVNGPFDVVCYWDGFGIGSDDDQRRLLRRIAGWLHPAGRALIDIFTPWYWANVAGKEQRLGDVARRYGFDADECRMVDEWWPLADQTALVGQSLRCYSPADLRLLLAGTGLGLVGIEPGGTIDETTGAWVERAPLARAMSYLAVLTRA
ncbi:MAG: class I SAM-dependent methyltransferase [Chloroflexota bacterium]|nr:class I SAM-dependent methyltransferase [Chloroflexota bacterium]